LGTAILEKNRRGKRKRAYFLGRSMNPVWKSRGQEKKLAKYGKGEEEKAPKQLAIVKKGGVSRRGGKSEKNSKPLKKKGKDAEKIIPSRAPSQKGTYRAKNEKKDFGENHSAGKNFQRIYFLGGGGGGTQRGAGPEKKLEKNLLRRGDVVSGGPEKRDEHWREHLPKKKIKKRGGGRDVMKVNAKKEKGQ